MMRLGKDAMYRQLDMPFDDALDYLRAQLSIAFTTEDIQEGVKAFFEKREPQLDGALTAWLSLVALRCRTADRDAGRAARGARRWRRCRRARSAWSRASIGTPGEPRETRYERGPARVARLPARGRRPGRRRAHGRHVPGAAGRRLLDRADARCPPWLRHRPGRAGPLARRATATSTRPTRTAAATSAACAWRGACGEWDAGPRREPIAAERVVLAGVRDLDAGERELLERSAATVIGASAVETLVAVKNALDGAPVFVHLDLDVLDPEDVPGAVPGAGRPAPDKLYDLLEAVAEDSRAGGHRGHGLRGARRRGRARRRPPRRRCDVLEPLLDRIAPMRQSGVALHDQAAPTAPPPTRSSRARRCARSSRTCTSAASRRGSAAARRRSRASTSRTSSPRASGSRC